MAQTIEPVSRKSKKAIGKDWQKRPVQLGAASSGPTDVDLDSMLAIGFAPGAFNEEAAA